MRLMMYCMLIFCLLSCKPEKEEAKAYVYDTTLYPRRGDHFALDVKYRFVYNNDTIRGVYRTYKRPVPIVGDSLRLEFPVNNPAYVEIISVIHMKQKSD